MGQLGVAEGREVYLGVIYPYLLKARMLGSTVFPWLINASLRTEDCLVYAFVIHGFLLSIIAYDYHEIGNMMTVFIPCLHWPNSAFTCEIEDYVCAK